MKTGVKHFIAGGALVLLSTLFIPEGMSGFARSAAFGEPVQAMSTVLIAIGALLVLAGIALFARGHVLRYRARLRGASHDTASGSDAS